MYWEEGTNVPKLFSTILILYTIRDFNIVVFRRKAKIPKAKALPIDSLLRMLEMLTVSMKKNSQPKLKQTSGLTYL